MIEARSRDPASQSKLKAPGLSLALIGERLRALWESLVTVSTEIYSSIYSSDICYIDTISYCYLYNNFK